MSRSTNTIRQRKLRVLLAEDHSLRALQITELLSRSTNPEIDCRTVGDPVEAIRRIEQEPFDLILMSDRLAGIEGLEILQRINKYCRHPVIVLSTQEEEANAVDYLRAGACDCVRNTMDRSAESSLLRAIRRVLRGRKAEAMTGAGELSSGLGPLRLARALDASLDGVVITDLHGRIEYVNPAFTRISGYEAADVLGRRSRFSQLSPDRRAIREAIRGKLSHGEEWQGEVLNRRKDGGVYFADMTISPIRDDAGRLVGFVSSERDVTERKIFTDELIKAREAAEDSLRAKDMFLATVSHELRTPLTSIIGFADLLLLEPGLGDQAREFAESILRGGRHLQRLISNILDLSRSASGRFYLDLESLQLREVLKEALDMVATETGQTPPSFELQIDPGLPDHLVIDRMKLQQVLLNLLTNAVKYAGGGEIRLNVQPLFRMSEGGGGQESRPDTLLFSVSDSGPGIPADEQNRIFDSFVQLRGSDQHSRGGAGLGLSISRRLVELMGGTIWVDSTPGEGSRFSFVLPLATPDEDAIAEAPLGGTRSSVRPPLILHRMVPGPVPGEGELASWRYQIAVTSTPEEMRRTIEAGDPFACLVSGTDALSSVISGVAEAAALAGDRVAWFVYARCPSGEVVPMGRIVPLDQSLGPRTIVRLMRALDTFPPGVRRLLVDPEDHETVHWAHATFDARGLRVIAASEEGFVDGLEEEDVQLLLLDLSRDPARTLTLWRAVADRTPRVLIALRQPAGDTTVLSARFDHAWRRVAPSFRRHSGRRLRWMLNALHTAASRGRATAASPCHDPRSAGAPAPESISPPDHPILVVDDDPDHLRLLCTMLRSLNLPHMTACDGGEALDITASTKPSLVLMDIEMTGMDGREAIQAIRRAAKREHLPIIALTARVELEDRRRCHEVGCVDFLGKPVDQGDLRRVLQRWIHRPLNDASSETEDLPASEPPSIAR